MKAIRAVLPAACGLAIALVLSACDQATTSRGFVEFWYEPDTGLINYNDHHISAATVDGSMVMYLSGPSLFYVGPDAEEILYLYVPEDGNQVSLRTEDGILFANDLPRAITLDKENESHFIQWYDEAKNKDLKALRIILINEMSSLAAQERLAKLQGINPHVLCLSDPDWIAPLEQAPWFLHVDLGMEDATNFVQWLQQADLSETRVLMFEDNTSDALDILSAKTFPNLHHLCGSPDMGLEAFANVKVITTETVDGLHLENLKQLEELHLIKKEDPQTLDLSRLPNPELLRTLSLNISTNTSGLEHLANLEYLNPGHRKFTNEELTDLLRLFPDLVYLNLSLAKVESLEPLRELPKLVALALGEVDAEEDDDIEEILAPLQHLKHLRYLAFNDELDQDELAMIRKVCPDVVIFLHNGFCMGSGWLLLLFPVMIAILIGKRVRTRVRQED